jgi:hypothetical protein
MEPEPSHLDEGVSLTLYTELSDGTAESCGPGSNPGPNRN